MNEEQILKLREILLNEFSEEELAAFSAELGLDYAALPGEGQFGKTRAMFLILREQDRLQALRSRLRDLRPAAFDAAGLNLVAPAPENARRLPIPLAWLVLGLVGVLVIVCVLTFLLRPAGTPASPAPTQDAAAAAAQETASAGTLVEPPASGDPITDTGTIDPNATAETNGTVVTDTAPGQAEMVPTLVIVSTADTAAQAAAQAPTAEPAPATPAPPTATPTVSETHPAALAVTQANAQLVPYFQGSADQASLTGWQGAALQDVIAFSKGALLRRLKVAEADRAALVSTVTYLRRPVLISQRNTTTFVVDSREYWTYQTTPNNLVCETRDYRYIVVQVDATYKISQSPTSKLVSSACNPA